MVVTPELATAVAPSFARRLCIMAYESLLLIGVLVAAALPFGILTGTRHALDNRHALQLFLFVVMGCYFTWFWAKGQTLAMKTWHVQLKQVNGQNLTAKVALLRYLLSWILIIPPAFIAWQSQLDPKSTTLLFVGWILTWVATAYLRKDKQSLHDIMCGTRLFYEKPMRADVRPPAATSND